MLFASDRGLVHSASFCIAPGTEGGFNYEDHFDWGARLGSGSFADVYEVYNPSPSWFYP